MIIFRPQGGDLGMIVDMRVINSLQEIEFVLPTPPSFSDLASTIWLVGESTISKGENIKRARIWYHYVDHLWQIWL